MRNEPQWRPSKYVYRHGRLVASRDPGEVSVGSRLIGDLVAGWYDAALKVYAHGRLIDLGCGKVPLHASYRELVTADVCVDWANSTHKNQFLDTECDLTERLPFESETFDTIILSDVLEHISRPEDLWAEMSRILAPGGHILLNVPFTYWLHEEPHDYYRYTEFALRRFVSMSGLELIELRPIGGTPEVLADLVAKHLAHMHGIGEWMADLVQRSTLALVRTRAGHRVSQATSAKVPLGYFLVAAKAAASSEAGLPTGVGD